MDESISQSWGLFDDDGIVLGDDSIVMDDGIQDEMEVLSIISDDIEAANDACLDSKGINAVNEVDFVEDEVEKEDIVDDDNFLMMQEPIVEEPVQVYIAMLPENTNTHYDDFSSDHHYSSTGHERTHNRHLYRHTSWTAPGQQLGQVSPERGRFSSTSSFCSPVQQHQPATSGGGHPPKVFQNNLEHLANCLRQSEASRRMIQRIHNQEAFRESTPVISYPVDETRRSLLSFIQETRQSMSSRPTVQRSKSTNDTPTRMGPTRPRRVQRCKSTEVPQLF